jgi:polysaccharide export outer membrane protein
MRVAFILSACAAILAGALLSPAAAQSPTTSTPPAPATSKPPAPAPAAAAVPLPPVVGVVPPPGYVIGPEDLLSVIFWREKDLSGDVIVRPDGKISLPLLNDVQAAGYTPEQLAALVADSAAKFVADPLATVIVKQINSRKVYVLGAVGKQGPVLLTGEMDVLQLIGQVGGLQDYADSKKVIIVRKENGRERRIRFNYDEVIAGKKTEQNIKLQPGDTVLVK